MQVTFIVLSRHLQIAKKVSGLYALYACEYALHYFFYFNNNSNNNDDNNVKKKILQNFKITLETEFYYVMYYILLVTYGEGCDRLTQNQICVIS